MEKKKIARFQGFVYLGFERKLRGIHKWKLTKNKVVTRVIWICMHFISNFFVISRVF